MSKFEFENESYINVAGIVAWDSEERELKSGDIIKTFTVEIIPSGTQLKTTLWPELAHVDVKKGDFVALRGKYTIAQVDDKVFQNLSASSIALVPAEFKVEADDPAGVI